MAVLTPGPGRRKRARSSDDAASSPAMSPSTATISAKRRRLGHGPPSPSSRPTRVDSERWLAAARPVVNPYDVPDSDDELAAADVRRPRNDREQEREQQEEKSSPATPTTRSGRRSANADAKSAPSRSTTARRPAPSPAAVGTHDAGTGAVAPRRRGRPPKVQPDAATTVSWGFPLAVKARIYGPTKNDGSSVAVGPPKLKGILSPRKRKAGRPAKSVIFDESEGVGSALPQTVARPRPALVATTAMSIPRRTKDYPDSLRANLEENAGNNEVHEGDDEDREIGKREDEDEGEEEEEEQDDEVCAICSQPDSEPPNEIIFCEVCDSGFHQKCYNVPTIPKGDWICRTCSQEDVLAHRPDATEKKDTVSVEVPGIPNFAQHFEKMRRVLLDRCSGNRRIKLRGQAEAYEKAYRLLEQTVLAGEGNSMMVIGGRGCGKTIMVEEVLSELRTKHAEEFHVVRLNGFIHTDDKLALKEIWRQLGREMEVEDDLVDKTNNYADTMASLLALLSHPGEISEADDGVRSKSVIFIIDEFELFATHARQTLLYNLFDIAQARKAPIAVLGLTTRIDVVESLEKRVKSRFSHRYVYLSLPKSLPAYWDICKQGLIVDKEDLEGEGFDTSLDGLYKFHDYWNEKTEALRRRPSFESQLEYHYSTTKSVPAFLTSCIQPLSVLSISSPDLAFPSSPSGTISLGPQEPKLQLLAALSDLELALLISAARLDIVAHTDTVNFAMAYDEYSAQMGRQRVQTASSGLLALGGRARVWNRGVAVVAWERLVSLGLLTPAGIGGRSNAAHGGLEGKMWKMDVSLEEIPLAVELPGFLAKWCVQI